MTMQHRQTYHPPNTPSFSLDASGNAQSPPPAPTIPSSSAFAPLPSPASGTSSRISPGGSSGEGPSSGGGARTTGAGGGGGGGGGATPGHASGAAAGGSAPGAPSGTSTTDYFANEKYPPARSPTSGRFHSSAHQSPHHHASPASHASYLGAQQYNGSSSVHLPLLRGDANGFDDDDDDLSASTSSRRGGGGAGTGARSSKERNGTGSNGSVGEGGRNSSRSRGGILVGIVGLLSPRSRVHPLVLVPVFMLGVFFSMSVVGNGNGAGALGRSAMSSLMSLRDQPADGRNYTLHSSGHLFLSPRALHPSSPSSPFSPAEAAKLPPHSIRHPIFDLIQNATREWDAKVKRQSKTLDEAVKEYKRRHGRNPPKGFDDWFKFAQDNDVVLIDEFDQTYTDILPFWALPPSVISARAAKLETDPSTFTMVINPRAPRGTKPEPGHVSIVGAHAKDGRAKDQRELMKRWSKWVPGSVNITMAAHDGPSIMMDHTTRSKHVEAAKKGKYLASSEYDEVDEDAALWGFPLACPPNSRLRRAYDGLEIDNLPKGPSFVADHVQTMNLCENPEWQYLHGFTSWPGMRPQTLRPLFSFAKTSLHSDILLTPLEQYWDREPWDPAWEDKPYNKAVWRGSTTGVWFDRGTWWRSSQRVRLWFMGKDTTGSRRVRFSGEGVETKRGVASLVEKDVATVDLMDRYVDFAFTGREGQCSEEDGSCEAVRNLFDFQRTFGWNEANEYKYMLDLDGNAWSGRFHRLLSTNSVVLKSTIFPEWYAGWIQPWVHYIPIKIDYTDLFDVMAFFSGDLDGENHHEVLAKQIADNGKDYTERFWRYADMEAYFFRLTLEWARVSSHNREDMDYKGPGSDS